MKLNQAKKCVWIDKDQRIVSFHPIPETEVRYFTEDEYWQWVIRLLNSGYRVM